MPGKYTGQKQITRVNCVVFSFGKLHVVMNTQGSLDELNHRNCLIHLVRVLKRFRFAFEKSIVVVGIVDQLRRPLANQTKAIAIKVVDVFNETERTAEIYFGNIVSIDNFVRRRNEASEPLAPF